jgi:PhnB protein
MEFHRDCFGAELFLLPVADVPGGILGEDDKGKIAHATIARGATMLMGSDNMGAVPLRQGNHSAVMIECDVLEEVEGLFAALSAGDTVTMALQDTFWGARFGTLTDRFGTQWMFNCPIHPPL